MSLSPKLLIVDDDPTVLSVMKKLAIGAGYTTFSVQSGEDALRTLETGEKIDVLITDVCMPGMDGMELLRKVKAGYPDVEVIMVTGFGTLETAVQTLRHGAVDYLKKPFKVDEFLGAIERAVDHRRSDVPRTF